MMIGTCKVENGKVVFSKTTYPITKDTHTDVRRIIMAPALLCASGLSVFGIGFFDLLYPVELFIIIISVVVLIVLGFQAARMVILDRVTRGTEQMSAIYGLHSTLQECRAEIDLAVAEVTRGAK